MTLSLVDTKFRHIVLEDVSVISETKSGIVVKPDPTKVNLRGDIVAAQSGIRFQDADGLRTMLIVKEPARITSGG